MEICMSDMLNRYNDSKKPRLLEAHQIPNLAVNFFDQNSEFQDGFVVNEKKGDPSKFTTKAKEYYNVAVRNILFPDGFQPTDIGIDLHRYLPSKKYYNPGKTK